MTRRVLAASNYSEESAPNLFHRRYNKFDAERVGGTGRDRRGNFRRDVSTDPIVARIGENRRREGIDRSGGPAPIPGLFTDSDTNTRCPGCRSIYLYAVLYTRTAYLALSIHALFIPLLRLRLLRLHRLPPPRVSPARPPSAAAAAAGSSLAQTRSIVLSRPVSFCLPPKD